MPNWMTNVYAATAGGASPLGGRPLTQVIVPGTHDAGCYTNTLGAFLGRTQSDDVAGQLNGGIRYFDLRPCKSGQEFWTYHGPYWGGRLDGGAGIIADVANFMGAAAAAQELVILDFSHFNGFNASDHHRLIAEVINRLGAFLVPHHQTNFNLFNSTYDAVLTAPGGGPVSRVAVLYDGALDQPLEDLCHLLPNGFFRLAPKYPGFGANQILLFDQYANQANLAAMRGDQMNKLSQRANYTYSERNWPGAAGNWTNNAPYGAPPTGIQDTWHLFSWTLTTQPWGSPLTAAQTTSNPALEGWFTGNNWPTGGPARGYDPTQDQRINVLYVDDYGSQAHNCLVPGGGCPRAGYAAPVALCEFINRNFIAGAWPGWAGQY